MEGIIRPRTVIVGAGFAGLWCAKRLASAGMDVLVVDRNNYHTFFPLLYQVAAAEVEPEQIAYPVRGIFRRRPNLSFAMGRVDHVDFDHRKVQVGDRSVAYDYLVLATGSVTNFFGVPGAARHSYRLKNLEQGIGLRNHILTRFEAALHEKDTAVKRRALTFTIVGGGPTGVEYSGALAELVAGTLARDYPSLNLSDVRVVLLEAADGLLAGFPPELRQYTLRKLESLGVEVRLRAEVAEVRADAVLLASGEILPTDTVVWTAGVAGSPLAQRLGLPVTKAGQVLVLPTLQVPDRPEVYVIGDLCRFDQNGRPLPMTAPVAIQQGRHAAKNIRRHRKGKPPKPFRYRDRGAMATIGRKAAVVRILGRAWSGLGAWIMWLFIHLLYLVGFRNRLFVLTNWAWDYFFFERGVRLILPKETSWVRQETAGGPEE